VPTSRCETVRRSHQREVQQLARLRTADHAACESLIEQYGERMLAVARRMLRNEEDAADAVQDAFLAAFVSLRRFRGQARISTWLHRIVVNQCLMKLRSQKRRATLSLDALGSHSEDGGGCWEAVAACDPAAAQVDQLETRLAVRRSIQQLPADFREILILRDIEEFDTNQTAALLDLSRAATKTRLHRARQALRAELEAGELAFAGSESSPLW
jgi:RNA polymerase sigma-70 factor (ECF subfamily)